MRSTTIALALATLTLAGTITGCTRQDTRAVRRAWKNSAGIFFERVDLNNGTRKELADVPGLSGDDADRIIANRPYGAVRGLLKKNVLTKEKFELVRDFLYVD